MIDSECGVVKWVKCMTLFWCGQMKRMHGEDEECTKVCGSEIEGPDGRSRPPVRGVNMVEQYGCRRKSNVRRGKTGDPLAVATPWRGRGSSLLEQDIRAIGR